MKTLRCVVAMALLGAASQALALNPGATVDNFRLLDHRGKAHELYYLSDMKAVVVMVQQNGCEVSGKSVAALNELRTQYEAKGVPVFMLNSSLKDDRASIVAETEKLSTTIPVLDDELQLIGESLGATKAGEVLVINPTGWKLAYRGPLAQATQAVESLVAGTPVKTAKVESQGCAVSMPQSNRAQHARISYSKSVAPILADKCVTCHREGGIGPWQMTSYEIVKGFSPMIREVLRTDRMPPWDADPHYGVFKNDRSLTGDEVKTLVHWIEAGAPKDKGEDPLKSLKNDWPEWAGGQPDLIVETPSFTVPATGTIDYQNPVVKNTIGRDVWVRAVGFNPGNRTVVHHILAYGVKAGSEGGNNRGGLGTYLAGYVPGGGIVAFPEDTGVFLPKDMDFRFQIHYTASGKEASDVTRIGIYYTDEAPKYPLRQFVLADPRLKIPPNTKEHRIVAPPRTFDQDVLVYSLTAHSHYRGKSSKYIARYPDGREEVLLSVPRYDFNWQTAYDLKEPKMLPKGTTLIYDTTYDNSSQNKANPDPNIEVRWGEQSWNEMIYGNVRYRNLGETTEPRTTAQTAKP